MLAPAPTAPLIVYGDVPDEQADRMDAASAEIRRWCGWHIAPVLTQTFTVDGAGSLVCLPTLRLVDVVAVSQDGVATDLTTLEWSHDGYIKGLSSTKLRGVQVTIQHGFESVPDLEQVIRDLASRAQPAGVKSRTNGQMSVTYEVPGLMQHERGQLALYRLPRRS